MKAKSQDTIRRELRRVHKVKESRRKKGQLSDPDFRALYGAEQASGTNDPNLP